MLAHRAAATMSSLSAAARGGGGLGVNVVRFGLHRGLRGGGPEVRSCHAAFDRCPVRGRNTVEVCRVGCELAAGGRLRGVVSHALACMWTERRGAGRPGAHHTDGSGGGAVRSWARRAIRARATAASLPSRSPAARLPVPAGASGSRRPAVAGPLTLGKGAVRQDVVGVGIA